jgi:tetratricopeptide (TPR) repeat protein
MRRFLPLLIALLPLPAAGECPAQDEAALAAERAPLFEALQSAPTEMQGREIADRIWRSWHRAPDATAQDLLDTGMRRIRISDYAEAERVFSELVAYCPDYPEGYNQRAFARFLAGDLDGALEDLDRAIELEPRHFGALAGRGLALLRQGRVELGQRALREAVAVNPWITERHLLTEPPGQKI